MLFQLDSCVTFVTSVVLIFWDYEISEVRVMHSVKYLKPVLLLLCVLQKYGPGFT
jgi:hypothetical protein